MQIFDAVQRDAVAPGCCLTTERVATNFNILLCNDKSLTENSIHYFLNNGNLNTERKIKREGRARVSAARAVLTTAAETNAWPKVALHSSPLSTWWSEELHDQWQVSTADKNSLHTTAVCTTRSDDDRGRAYEKWELHCFTTMLCSLSLANHNFSIITQFLCPCSLYSPYVHNRWIDAVAQWYFSYYSCSLWNS